MSLSFSSGKALAPEYEVVSSAFAREKSVTIAEVNCDVEKDLCSEYGVTGFPTVKFFSHGEKPEDYNGERKAQSIVDWINARMGTKRQIDGKLPSDAGRIGELDTLVAGFIGAENKAAVLVEAKAKVDKLESPEAAKNRKYYIKVMEKTIENKDYVTKEKQRLTDILNGNSVHESKIDDFTVRLNILGAFN